MLKIRMDFWYKDEGKIYAYWNDTNITFNSKLIQGSPMGCGNSENAAITNLIYRTNMESGTEITHSDVEVHVRNGN